VTLLAVRGLTVTYRGAPVVDCLDFDVDAGESVGLVGESGSGKSQTALAVMGLLPRTAATRGSVRFGGREILGLRERELKALRATRIAMVFQDSLEAMNPYVRIGRQLGHILRCHGLADANAAKARVLEMLAAVGLPDPDRQARAYPHQLSGGMRQRVMLAAALIAGPDLLIADEPTSALDVTVQAQILDLLARLRQKTALLLITHDLGVVAGHCDRVVLIERGRRIEEGVTGEVFAAPSAAYTRRLLQATPQRQGDVAPAPAVPGPALLETRGLSAAYREPGRGRLHAVKGVDLDLAAGETLAIVGESGSGKSSLARAILGLVPASAGRVVFAGVALPADLRHRAQAMRRDLQLVFQDPVASLNPQLTVEEIVAEPLVAGRKAGRRERRDRVTAMLEKAGLSPEYLGRHAHELSGGQAQRVAIARALIVEPRVLVCDEAVAALDGTTRARILDLLADLQRQSGLAILFIAHDLAVVRQISHRVMVMYLGQVVEVASGRDLFTRPVHPYTRALIDAVPTLDGRRPPVLQGEVPSPLAPPPGCAFHPRCPYAEPRCALSAPALEYSGGRLVACLRAGEIQ
jgi:oligopeptide/dipeptide ABC transporter ATP-binding protein